jgi:hypothetical protein
MYRKIYRFGLRASTLRGQSLYIQAQLKRLEARRARQGRGANFNCGSGNYEKDEMMRYLYPAIAESCVAASISSIRGLRL